MRQNGVGISQPAKVTLSRVRAHSLKTTQTGGLSRNVGKLRGTTHCHSYDLLVAEQILKLFTNACCSMTSTAPFVTWSSCTNTTLVCGRWTHYYACSLRERERSIILYMLQIWITNGSSMDACSVKLMIIVGEAVM